MVRAIHLDCSRDHKFKGLVAQLNSAPDYGSGGYRFESCRGHIKELPFREAFFVQVLSMDENMS